MLGEIRRRLRMLLRGPQFDADLQEEMRLHRELRAQEETEHGLTPEEAHYAAQRRFGNDLVLREESRDMWGWNWLETLFRTFAMALRQLRRNPGFTAAAVINAGDGHWNHYCALYRGALRLAQTAAIQRPGTPAAPLRAQFGR